MPYKNGYQLDKDRAIAALWAKNLLAGNYGDWCILDTETTGLNRPEIIDICITSKYRSPMINTRLRPATQIEKGATYIHGLRNEDLADCPSFSDVRDRIQEIVKNKLVIIYNKTFDTAALFCTAVIHNQPRVTFKSTCAMLQYAAFCNEWSNYWGNYKWQKLPGGNHTAYGDCLAVHNLLEEMAAYIDECNKPIPPKPRLFPPVQIGCRWEPKYNIRIDKISTTSWHQKINQFRIKTPKFYIMSDKDIEE